MIDLLREALGDERAWLVGGTLRDRLLGRETLDIDLVVDGDVRRAARKLGRAAQGASFELSDQYGAWRVVARDRSWQVDVVPLQGGSLEADLAARDLTVNAMAEPVAGGALIDPHGGAADLAARRLRLVSEQALAADPLRALRVARIATELEFEIEPATAAATARYAPELAGVAPERVFAELKRLIVSEHALRGLALMDELALTPHVLPELDALRGVAQSRYHHRDVHGHTLEVLQAVIDL
ncbi:MAG: CCA tRNA nucleotidyltransferase, partial [Solirubrobacteraceae bacterium]